VRSHSNVGYVVSEVSRVRTYFGRRRVKGNCCELPTGTARAIYPQTAQTTCYQRARTISMSDNGRRTAFCFRGKSEIAKDSSFSFFLPECLRALLLFHIVRHGFHSVPLRFSRRRKTFEGRPPSGRSELLRSCPSIEVSQVCMSNARIGARDIFFRCFELIYH